jgi:ectoine hydroxylase-related dioxygenase (phytanoyl-CoA dioxygenase family)
LENHFESDDWGPWSSKEGITYAHAPGYALEQVVALRIHLDASTESNGPLQVIPGSHLLGVLEDDAVFDHAHNTELVNCLVSRGGVIAMRPLLIHASSKAQTNEPRRVLHIEYSEKLEIADNVRLTIA